MKTTTLTRIFIPVLLALTLIACENNSNCLRGNGVMIEETRELPEYNSVVTEGEFEIFYVPSDSFQVVLNTDENIIPYIRTIVSGTTLIVDNGTRKCLRSEYPIQIFVHTPEIRLMRLEGSGLISAQSVYSPELKLEIEGSGYIDVAGIDVLELTTTITGSGEVDLWGEADKASYIITGSGKIDARDLISNDCLTEISGSGDIYCHALENLNVYISGAGNIYYKGSPSLEFNISGIGAVIKLDN